MSHQTIIVLDFGSQYTQLIARRLRELSVYSEIWPPTTPIEKLRALKPAGVILSGGPKSVSDPGAPVCDAAVFDLDVPVLGICYGMQLMAARLGGTVAPAAHREFGHATVAVATAGAPAALFHGVPGEIRVWASHGDFVAAAPPGFTVAATSANAPVAAMANPDRRLYALLFHPEVVHTEFGLEIIRNFAFGVCGCTGDWTMKSFVQESVSRIRAKVGDGRVVCGLSGGVDSTVAALLIHKAIGDHLTCIFVDNGVLRLDEANADPQAFRAPASAAGVRGRIGPLPRSARRCDRPREEAQDHRQHLHRRLRGRSTQARAGRFPGAGDALSRCHRVGAGRRPVGGPSRATTTSAVFPSGCG
ncbi:MAG: glutamine-hydrolyzing GMP synthase [Vicinamibacterales bacterium]